MPVNPNVPAVVDATAVDGALLAEIGMLFEHDDPAAIPDPAYLKREHDLFTALCRIYGAGNVALAAEDVDDAGNGGLLVQRPTPWRVNGCTGLTEIADELYGGEQ